MQASQKSLCASIENAFTFWFDRDVRFDIPSGDLEVQKACGEILLATLRPVEDTKGNNGEEGVLFVTNLRCMWHSARNRRKNLSIGYYGVQGIDVKQANSLLCGTTEAIYIIARLSHTRFEFVFTYLGAGSRLFSTVPAVWRAYDASRTCRELRLRSSIIRDGELILLPGEQLFTRQKGVSSVSQEQGNIGTLFTTNMRIAWCAQHEPELNVSIPFLQLIALRIRSTKFGLALVLETSKYSGNFLLGFRVDPISRLQELFKESAALWKAWVAHPILGIAVVLQDIPNDEQYEKECDMFPSSSSPGPSELFKPSLQDGENVVQEVKTDAFAAYYADMGQKGCDRRPEYDTSIGLAVEKLRSGVTLQDLWTITT